MDTKFKNDVLEHVVKIAKENGLKVYRSEYNSNKKEPISYVHITDGTNICYCQASDHFGAVDFSTVHVPNKQTGSGFRMYSGIHFPDLSHITQTFRLLPSWVSLADVQSVKMFKNWADYEAVRDSFCRYIEL